MKSNFKLTISFSLLDVSKHLRIAEEFAKVDVEEMSRRLDHDVVVVTVTNTENVRDNAVTGT